MTDATTFRLMTVRGPADGDGRLYPLVGSADLPFEREPADGEIRAYRGLGLRLTHLRGGRRTLLAEVRDEHLDFFVTQARVVFVFEKWNKGSRYWGVGLGATSALIDNIANNLRERRARRGQLLMGHIRYNWLTYAGVQGKTFGGHDTVRFGCSGGEQSGDNLEIQTSTTRGVDPSAVVESVLYLAAQRWLRCRDLTAEQVAEVQRYLSVRPDVRPGKGKVLTSRLPYSQRANDATSDPADFA